MDLVRFDILEVFQVIEEFILEAEERELDLSIPMLDRLPRKNVRSRTAREVQEALAKRMLSMYETEITAVYDLRTGFARSIGKAFEPPHLTDSPQILKRRITDCDRHIANVIQEAHLFALKFGWSLTGGFQPETKEYKFEISKMSEVLQRRAA